MLVRSLLLVAGLCVSQSVAAVCYHEGRPYPTGARMGDRVCQADGTWRKVQRKTQVLPRPLADVAQYVEKSSGPGRPALRSGVA